MLMQAKTGLRRGTPLIVFLVLGLVIAGFALARQLSGPEHEITADSDAVGVIIGEGAYAFMVPLRDRGKVDTCTAEVVVTTRGCGDVKIVRMDAATIPFVTRNISLAWAMGKPAYLTKDSDGGKDRRRMVCGSSFSPKYRPNGSCDEYPFASTMQGGAGARTEEVPRRENSCQGGMVGRAYVNQQINDGDSYLVIITHPASIAPGSYEGVDIAKDQSCAA